MVSGVPPPNLAGLLASLSSGTWMLALAHGDVPYGGKLMFLTVTLGLASAPRLIEETSMPILVPGIFLQLTETHAALCLFMLLPDKWCP